jgi:hypothetical protein
MALGLINASSVSPASAVVVTATGTNPSICNQNMDVAAGVTAERLANGDCLIKFSSATTINWTLPATLTSARVLIVGGGGGGGGGGTRNGSLCSSADGAARVGGGGGGGGGGQVKDNVALSNVSGSLTVVVGSGGSAGAAANCGAAGSDGGTGGASSITTSGALQLVTADGGGGGGGGYLTGAGGTGGSSKDSSGTILSGGAPLSVTTCTDASTNGCYAAGGGASGVGSGLTPTLNGIYTNGAAGKDGVVVSAIVSARYGAGGGGGNRHPASSPAASGRAGGTGGLGGGGAGNAEGSGSSGTDFGGGGGGGRGNGAYNNSSNAGSGGSGFNGFVAITYTPDLSAPTFPSAETFNTPENTTSVGTITTSESATITIFGGEDQSKFSISRLTDSSTALSFITAPDFEAPTDVGANNTYIVVFRAVDGASNAGYETVTVTVTDVVDTSAFNSFGLVGSVTTATYRTTIQITANVTVSAKVLFKVNNVRIPGCINVRTSGTSPNIVAVCNWKPSRRGPLTLTATATPTGGGISGSSATPLKVFVTNRTGTR